MDDGGGQQGHSEDGAGGDGGLRPAVRRPEPERVREQSEARGGEPEPGAVERPRDALDVFAQAEDAEQDGGGADRHVHEEQPVPGQVLGEEAAQRRAQRGHQGRRHDEDLGQLGPFVRRERAEQQGHADRGQQAARQALHRPRHDQRGQAGRQAAGGRRGGEDGERAEEDALGAVAVAEPAGDRQGQREGDEEGRLDGVGRRDGLSEVARDGEQGGVDDGRVQAVHAHGGRVDEDDGGSRVQPGPGRRFGGGHRVTPPVR